MSNTQLADAAFLQVVSYNGEIFANSKQNDIAFYCDPQQKFLLGPKLQDDSNAPLTLAKHQVSVDVPCHIPELHSGNAHFSNLHTHVFTSDTFEFKNAQGSQLHINKDLRVDTQAVLADVKASTLAASNLDITNAMHVDGANAIADFSNMTASNIETQSLSSVQAAFSQCTVNDLHCENTLVTKGVETSQLHVKDRCDVSSFIGFSRKKT